MHAIIIVSRNENKDIYLIVSTARTYVMVVTECLCGVTLTSSGLEYVHTCYLSKYRTQRNVNIARGRIILSHEMGCGGNVLEVETRGTLALLPPTIFFTPRHRLCISRQLFPMSNEKDEPHSPLSPTDESDTVTPLLEMPEPKPGIDGAPVRCEQCFDNSRSRL